MKKMRLEITEKVEEYVRTELMKLAYFQNNIPRMAEYRIEHSFRVAHIAVEIAQAEGFNEEKAYVAGLLHDIGYSIDFKTKDEYREHGRIGARIARSFLKELGCYSDEEIDEICYAIAIHVDDKADFPGEKTPFTLSIGEADNIDRFDAYRLYEGLHFADYMNLPLNEQREFVDKRLTGLTRLLEESFATHTSDKMWKEKINYQIDFYKRLKNQIEKSC